MTSNNISNKDRSIGSHRKMIDIIVNGGKIEDIAVSKGIVTDVSEHASTIVISGSTIMTSQNGKVMHIKPWLITAVCGIIIVFGCLFIYGMVAIKHQATQLKQLETIFQNTESRLLLLEEKLNQREMGVYLPNEMNVDSTSQAINNQNEQGHP